MLCHRIDGKALRRVSTIYLAEKIQPRIGTREADLMEFLCSSIEIDSKKNDNAMANQGTKVKKAIVLRHKHKICVRKYKCMT